MSKKAAKVKNSKKTTKKPIVKVGLVTRAKNIWKNHWHYVLAAVIVVGFFGFVGINQLIIYNQKQQFKAAEKSLDAIYADVVKEVGQPTSANKDKGCSRASTKMGEGELGCGASVNLLYKTSSAADANSIKDKIVRVIKNKAGLNYLRDAEFKDGLSTVPGEKTAGDIKAEDGISFSFSIDYKEDGQDKNLKIDIGYGGHPKAEIYTDKD